MSLPEIGKYYKVVNSLDKESMKSCIGCILCCQKLTFSAVNRNVLVTFSHLEECTQASQFYFQKPCEWNIDDGETWKKMLEELDKDSVEIIMATM
jgi:hypothetical protein